MKIKLLLAPALVVGTLILLIWFVYPAYTNPSIVVDPSNPVSGIMNGANDGVKERYAALGEEEAKLATVDQRISNAKSLSAEISANVDKKEALYAFIPDSSKEEELIDMINYIAGKEGLSVINISVIPAKEEAVLPAAGVAVTTPSADPKTAVVVAKDVEVNVVVMGVYEQVKNTIAKIYSLKRFNKLTNLSVVPTVGADGKQNGNTLQVNLTLLFNMLKKSPNLVNAENPVFVSTKFNMGVIDNIQKAKGGEILKLESGPLGTVANPFLP